MASRVFFIFSVLQKRAMTLQLSLALLRKMVSKCVPYGHEPTERVHEAQASQARRWLQAPDIVFEDPDTGSSLSVGSSYNAAYLSSAPGDFDMVINCCPSELTVTHPRVREVDLRDSNTVTLDGQQMETLAAEVAGVMALPKQRVLIHCWVGASRSVAVAAYICCRLYGPTMDPVEDWDYFYADFQKARPSISVSKQLKAQTLALLEAAATHEVQAIAPPPVTTAATTATTTATAAPPCATTSVPSEDDLSRHAPSGRSFVTQLDPVHLVLHSPR
jgi:hypothetical protein